MTEAVKNLLFEDCRKSCTQKQNFFDLKDRVILMTGGTGFMGKWVAEIINYLNKSESFSTKLYLLGRNISKFKEEVPHLADQNFIVLIEQDIRNVHDLPADVNYIIHAAGSPDNRDHVSQPLRTLETFYKGTQAILDAASRLSQLHRIIHISSHQVYGKNEEESVIQERFLGKVELGSVNNVYAESKRAAEMLCLIYRNQFKLPILTVRPFSFIGPYHDLEKPWAINNFIRDGLLGGPIRILGNGSTIRTYLYGSDVASWILQMLTCGQNGETYNLGSSNAISLDELAQKIRYSINPGIEIISKSSRENYTSFSKLIPDVTKITNALNTEEIYTLDEAINRTIVWNQLIRN